MSDSTKKPSNDADGGACNCDYTLAFWMLRGWLAIRAILTGIEKFGAYKTIQKPLLDSTGQPDASGAMVDVKVKFYSSLNYSGLPTALKGKFANEVLLPPFAVNVFDHLLGPLLLASGIMLLLGLGTRLSLCLQGLIYMALTVGLILIHQDDGVSWLGIHIALVAFALVLAKNNKFAIFKKW